MSSARYRPVYVYSPSDEQLTDWIHRTNLSTRLSAGPHHLAENRAIFRDGRALVASLDEPGAVDAACHANPLGLDPSDSHVADLLIPAASSFDARKLGVDAVLAQLVVGMTAITKQIHGVVGEFLSLLPSSALRKADELALKGIRLHDLDDFAVQRADRFVEVDAESARRHRPLSAQRFVLAEADPLYVELAVKRLLGAMNTNGYRDVSASLVYHALDLQRMPQGHGRSDFLRAARSVLCSQRARSRLGEG